jgi:DNA polymerase-3 subunit gamma/tau
VPSGSEDAELLRRRWAEVLGTLERRRVTWVLVSQSAQVARVENGDVILAFSSPQLAERFGGGQHAENVSLAIRETLGLQVRVVAEAASNFSTPTKPAVDPAPAAAPVAAPVVAPARASEPVWQDPPFAPRVGANEDEASDADSPAPDAHLTGSEVIARMLGGTVVQDD